MANAEKSFGEKMVDVGVTVALGVGVIAVGAALGKNLLHMIVE